MGFFSKLFGLDSKTEEKPQAPKSGGNISADNGRNSDDGETGRPARALSIQDLEGFVDYVAKSLVDYPDEVKVCSESTANGKMIKIICRAGDRGKIIGKKGKTIMALRALVAGAAGRTRERISVEVPDDAEEVKE